jgi:hypothetical protein
MPHERQRPENEKPQTDISNTYPAVRFQANEEDYTGRTIFLQAVVVTTLGARTEYSHRPTCLHQGRHTV